ncbi:hypothetical protein [Insulibacter thermoxylanivorax]|nr:hypothetical protein [Insulibacter thermoxylanivorax]
MPIHRLDSAVRGRHPAGCPAERHVLRDAAQDSGRKSVQQRP